MRERIPLLVPLVCLIGWGITGFGVGMWFAALCGSIVTLLLAAPALFRRGAPISLPSLQAPPFSVERVTWSVALSLCVTAGALSIGSLGALTLGGGRMEVWTMTLLLGMLSVLACAPIAIFLRPDHTRPRSAADRTASANAPRQRGGDTLPRPPSRRQRQPADFIPQPIFDANRHLSRSRRSFEEKERRIEEFRSLWSYADRRPDAPHTPDASNTDASLSDEETTTRKPASTEVFTPNGRYSSSAADTFLNGTPSSSNGSDRSDGTGSSPSSEVSSSEVSSSAASSWKPGEWPASSERIDA